MCQEQKEKKKKKRAAREIHIKQRFRQDWLELK